MAFNYRIIAYTATGGGGTTIDIADDIEQADWTVDLYGNCLEANIECKSSTLPLTIGQRYIIDIETNLDSAGWVRRFRGVVTQPGNARSKNLSTVKLIGLKTRLYHTYLENDYYDEEDLYARINRVLSVAANRPAGTSFTAGTTHLPGSSGASFSLTMPAFVTGGMYVGTFLDKMAEASGKRWIVDAQGRIIFGDITGSQSLTEGSDSIEADFKPADSEYLVTNAIYRIPSVNYPDTVINNYYSVPLATSREAVRPVFIRSNASASDGTYNEDLIVEWDLGLPPYSRWAASSTAITNMLDGSLAQDQDLDTFAYTDDGALATTYQAQYSTRLLDGLYIKYTSEQPVRCVFENDHGSTTSTGATEIEYLEFTLPATDDPGEGKIMLIPHDPAFTLTGSTRWAQIFLTTETGIFTLYEVYGVSIDGLTGILSRYHKDPTVEVAKITKVSTALLSPTPTINLTPLVGSATSFTGGTLKHTITRDGGAVSEISAGQDYDPDAEALNALEEYQYRNAQHSANRFNLWQK